MPKRNIPPQPNKSFRLCNFWWERQTDWTQNTYEKVAVGKKKHIVWYERLYWWHPIQDIYLLTKQKHNSKITIITTIVVDEIDNHELRLAIW